MEDLVDAFLVLAFLLILAVAGPRWGVDSRPGINSRNGFFAFDNQSGRW